MSVVFIMLINVKMPTIVGILIFMSMTKFMLKTLIRHHCVKAQADLNLCWACILYVVCFAVLWLILYCINSLSPGLFFMLFLSSADFFTMNFFINSGIPSECQADWIQIKPDVLSGLIWVQTVCKSYKQTH